MNTEAQCCEICFPSQPDKIGHSSALYICVNSFCTCHKPPSEASALPRSVKIGDDPLQYAGGNGKTTTEGTTSPQPQAEETVQNPLQEEPQQEGWESEFRRLFGALGGKTGLVIDHISTLLTSARREERFKTLEGFQNYLLKHGYCDADVYAEPTTDGHENAIAGYLASLSK